MDQIASCIADCIFRFDEKKDSVASRVRTMTQQFPLYE